MRCEESGAGGACAGDSRDFDFVPNHLSNRHPWFIESRDRKSPKRDWFVWRRYAAGEGWIGTGGRSCWQEAMGAYYYAVFGGGMPGCESSQCQVRLEMARAGAHWLRHGIRGLRVDSVRYLYEKLDSAGEKSDREDRPETIAWFASFDRRCSIRTRRPICEVYGGGELDGERSSLLAYMGSEDRPGFQMTFDFPLLERY